MNQPTPKPAPKPALGTQLRAERAIAERRRDDADQLTRALDMAAQLADQCDRLLAENAELKRELEALTPPVPPEADDSEPVDQ